jgi:uncharacterized membrane protein YqjE
MTESTRPKRSLLALISDLPGLVSDLIAAEIEQLKAELKQKFTALGVGAGLIAGAAVVLLFMVGVLLTAAILALSLVMPGWLAALLVAVVLLLIAALLGWIGYRKLQAGIPPVPTETIASLQKDLNVVRGVGK